MNLNELKLSTEKILSKYKSNNFASNISKNYGILALKKNYEK